MFFNGIERDAKWVDENWYKIPPDLDSIIANTVRDYYKKYHKSEYMPREQHLNMMKWVRMMNILADMKEELC